MKQNLVNNYCKRDNYYSKIYQETLYFLDQYSKTTVVKTPVSEKLLFVQSGGQDHGSNNKFSDGNKNYEKKYKKKYVLTVAKKNIPYTVIIIIKKF